MGVSLAPYREQVSRSADPYLVAWAEYRWRRGCMWLLFVSWLPAGAIAEWALKPVQVDPGGRFFVRGLLLVLWGLGMTYCARLRCPNCDRPFHSGSRGGLRIHNVF